MNLFGRKKQNQADGVADNSVAVADTRPFEERYQELLDQADVVETPEELQSLAKSLTVLAGERLGLSKAAPGDDITGDDLDGEKPAGDDLEGGEPEGGDPEGGELDGGDPGNALEDIPGDDPQLDDEKTKDKAKKGAKPPAESTPTVQAPATGPLAAPGAGAASGGLSKAATAPDYEGVDAGPLIEALVEELADGRTEIAALRSENAQLQEGLTKSLIAITAQLGTVQGEFEDFRSWREGHDAQQEGITKSIAALAQRPVGTPRGAATLPVGGSISKALPAVERGEVELAVETEEGYLPSEIVKGLHAHIMAGHHETHKTGISSETIAGFNKLSSEERARVAAIAQKQLAGDYDGEPAAE